MPPRFCCRKRSQLGQNFQENTVHSLLTNKNKCFDQKRKVDADPSQLYYEGKKIVDLQWGCVRYMKKYVEECELLPMDYENKKECIPYWNHWGKHSRSESGTYTIEE